MGSGGDRETLGRLVRQHAATSALLGVGFVPSYRAGGAGGSAGLAGAEVETKPFAADADCSEPVDTESVAPEQAEQDEAVASVDPAASVDTAASVDPAALGDPGERLEALRLRYIEDAPHAAFDTSFTNIVFGEGDPCARLMFVGEAPGADEDKSGRPFVGRAGQLLDKMIVAMGLSRESVYIANVLKTRPPDNRTPSLEEARACAPYLFEQIGIVSPDVIVTLGRSASQLLLGTEESMGRLRGRWAAFPPASPLVPVDGLEPIAVMPTYHPAYLLRQYTADNRALVWSDLQQVMGRLGTG